MSLVKSVGGFRVDSPNYVTSEAIKNLQQLFKAEGYTLLDDGSINRSVLDNLSVVEQHEVLMCYAKRAIKGSDDAALLIGTSKDLIEAVATFILQQEWAIPPSQHIKSNFPTLLGQAFTALGLATKQDQPQPKETAQKGVERALYELACSINKLRNKEGTGHGRPFLPSVTDSEAKVAIEAMGIISEYLLTKLSKL